MNNCLKVCVALAGGAVSGVGYALTLASLDAYWWQPLVVFVPLLLAIVLCRGYVAIAAYAVAFVLTLLQGLGNYGEMVLALGSTTIALYSSVPFIFMAWLGWRGVQVPLTLGLGALGYGLWEWLVPAMQNVVAFGHASALLVHVPLWRSVTGFTGPYLATALVVLLNGLIALGITQAWQLIRQSSRRWTPLASTAGTLVIISLLLSIGGNLGLAKEENSKGAGSGEVIFPNELKVAVVQGSISSDEYVRSIVSTDVGPGRHLQPYLSMTAPLLAQDHLIIWPETVVRQPEEDDRYIDDLLTDSKARLLAGASLPIRGSGRGGQRQTNSVVLRNSGGVLDAYQKTHLVPVAEDSFKPGTGASLIHDDKLRIGTPVCYEIVFPGFVLDLAAQGPDLWVVLSNDATFGPRAIISGYMLNQARLVALLVGKPLIRAGQSGVSAVIDRRGQVLAQTEVFARTVLTSQVALNQTSTFYLQFSYLGVYMLLGLFLPGTAAAFYLPRLSSAEILQSSPDVVLV